MLALVVPLVSAGVNRVANGERVNTVCRNGRLSDVSDGSGAKTEASTSASMGKGVETISV